MPQGWILDVTLEYVRPTVKRRIEVPDTLSFLGLHEVIQAALGWTDTHLFEFQVGELTISVPDDDFMPSATQWDATQHTIQEVHWKAGFTFQYLYDFGDDWRHTIVVGEQVDQVDRPQLLSGTGPCPPEDVGGPPGYAEFVLAWAESHHPEHQAMRQWAQGRYETEFNLQASQVRVAKALSHRKA